MKFSPTKAELESGRSENLLNSPSDLMNPDLYVSGSKWSAIHLQALRVISWDDMEISKLIPNKHLPHPNSNVFKDWRRALTAVSRDELEQWDNTCQQHSGHRFYEFFEHLHNAMIKERDTWTTLPQAVPAPRGGTPDSHASHSSLENEPEMTSRLALHSFMNPLVRARSQSNGNWGMKVVAQDTPLAIYLGPDGSRPGLQHANNDGGLHFFEKSGLTGGHGSSGRIPVVSFEGKRRHVGGKHRSTGEKEAYAANTLAQEIAELLALALGGFRSPGSTQGDQEAYVMTVHGTQYRLAAAYFPAEYLHHIQSPSMPTDKHLYVRRSRLFELKDTGGRTDALMTAMGLINYLFSGHAVMEQVKDISSDLKKQ